MVRTLTALLLALPITADAYNIGIVGGGVVGGGIAQIITNKAFRGMEIKRVAVRDASKKRDWMKDVPDVEITEDVSSIVGADDIDLVVEVAGGVTDAKDIVWGALKAGQDVVTANKALIAANLAEIEGLVSAADAKTGRSVQFGLEAAVMGGIPIIHSLQNDFVGDDINELQGIMNGCTNYMLEKMEQDGVSYSDCLKQAQELGYAEADPTLDVGGQDARSKLKILLRLAFGQDVEEDAIPCDGITEITETDFEYAQMEGGTIKLIGNAKKSGNKLYARVSPAFVPSGVTLASIGGATNAVEIKSDNLGSTLLVGQGAGRYPTANSCVSDIVRAQAGSCPGASAFGSPKPALDFDPDYESAFYLRCNYKDALGITRTLGEICEKNKVSIFSMLQAKGVDSFVVLVEECKASAIQEVAKELAGKSWCQGTPFVMPCVSE